MAQKRMTSLEVIDTDAFLDMPQSSQLLYFHLNARADDDGFVANPKRIMRDIGSQSDDLKMLAIKKFIISFEDGVCVIKHWRINNFIRKDIYKETKYLNWKQTLLIRPNGAYTQTDDGKALPIPKGHYILEDVDEALTKRQPSIDKSSIDKVSIEKNNISKEIEVKPQSYGNEDINKVYKFLKEKLSGTPDGSVKDNRRFAKLLLDKMKKDYPDKVATEQVNALIEFGLKDSFHSKNLTSFKYLYYNSQKIIQSAKGQIENPKYIKIK